MTDTKPKVVFSPGAFDNFEGTQEELDQLVKEIVEMFQSPEKLAEISAPVNWDDLNEVEADMLLNYSQIENRVLQ